MYNFKHKSFGVVEMRSQENWIARPPLLLHLSSICHQRDFCDGRVLLLIKSSTLMNCFAQSVVTMRMIALQKTSYKCDTISRDNENG